MTEKKFNIIFIVIALFLVMIISIMTYMIVRNEASRNYFDEAYIEKYNWKNNIASFSLKDDKVTLSINDDKMYDEKEVKFNSQTGEVIEGKLYVRSLTTDNLVIWYESEEYRLQREIIAR